MMRHLLTACAAAAVLALPLRADDRLTVKVEKTELPKELSERVRGLLDDQALQLLDNGQPYATLWLRKTVPAKATPEQIKGGLTYREIPETSVIGAVQFPQPWSDYRKQKIPAGVYTLRLAFQPQNGDHMGTAPFNEFLLLSPAAKDTSPDTMEPKELHELSANAPGASHPGVMLLYPSTKPADEPKLEGKPNNTWVLYLKRAVDAEGMKAALGFGLTVAGHTTQE